MKTISAAEANRSFSKLLRNVQSGQSITITSRGKPVARMEPAGAPECQQATEERERDWQAFLAELRAKPALNLGPIRRDEIYDD